MRIVGGKFGGRKINPPARMPYTRPTTDIAKEGLFNILQNNLDLESMKTLDLFGGTGSISYELASRGATDLTIVEKDPAMYEFIKKTSVLLEPARFNIIKMDVFKFIEQCTDTFDFVFAGPPYALESIDKLAGLVVQKPLINPEGWFVLEHTPKNDYKDSPAFVTQRKYGTTVFSVFINRSQ